MSQSVLLSILPPATRVFRLSLMLGAGLASAVQAQTVTVSTATTTPIVTATASNNAPANLSVTTAGSITVATGPAVTLNSSNTVANAGTITSAGSTNTSAVLVDLTNDITGTITNDAVISVTGTTAAVGNTGIRFAGPGTFTGNIVSGSGSNITVSGNDATGILIGSNFVGNIGTRSIGVTGTNSRALAITSGVTGNISNRGVLSASGAGSTAVQIAAGVSGTITNGGTISAGTDQTFDATNNRVPAVAGVAGVHLGASVGGGFINDRFFVDGTGAIQPAPADPNNTPLSLVTANITAFAGAPALLVAPIGDDNVTIGVAGTGDNAYAVINRGNIQALGRDSGKAASAVRFGATGLAPGRVILDGGFANQANGIINVSTVDAAATGIDVSAGASVPTVRNAGTIAISAAQTPVNGATPAGTGGTATAILVRQGGSLASVVNTNTIDVVATGSNNAWGIRDLAGSITSVTNSGTISTSPGANGGAIGIAIDLSAGTGAVQISNSGTIRGNIIGGSGATSVLLTGGTVTGNLALGAGANVLSLSGGARVVGSISSIGGVDLSIAGVTTLDLSGNSTLPVSSLAMTGASTLVIGVRSGQPGLAIAGTASFDANSRLRIAVTNVTQSQNLTLLTAAGGITAASPSALVDVAAVPFLYTLGAATVGTNSIEVTLNRKTAAQIGLAPGVGSFFDQSLAALAGDATGLGAAIGNLSSQADFLGAYRQLLPASFSQAPLRVAAAMSDGGFGNISQRLSSLRIAGKTNELDRRGSLGLWASEIGNFARQREDASAQGFAASTLGLSIGVDKPLFGLDALGIAFSFGWSDVDYGGIQGQPLLINTQQVDIYAAKSWGNLFVALNAGGGRNSSTSQRTKAIGAQTGTIASKWSGTSFSGNLQVGYTFEFGRLRIIPSDTISYLSLRQNSFTETGAGPLSLSLDSNTQTAATNTAKLGVDYVIPSGEGAWRIGASAGYVSQLGASDLTLTGRFAGGGNPFILTADAIRSSETQFGAHGAYSGPGWVAIVGYDRRQAGGYVGQSISATFRLVL